VSVELVETLEEIYLAVRTRGLTPENLAILFAALFPERAFDEIETASENAYTRPRAGQARLSLSQRLIEGH
jgi:hypothetical protein